MILRAQPFFNILLLFSFSFIFFTIEGSAQEKAVTIQGNLQRPENAPEVVDYYFNYRDLVSHQKINIPINRDLQGDFKVSFPISGDQEIQLSSIINRDGQRLQNDMIYLSFLVKQGQTIAFDFPVKDNLKTTEMFRGKDGLENNQYMAFKKALDDKEAKDKQQLFDYQKIELLKTDIPALTTYLSTQLARGLAFHNAYFQQHRGTKYVQEQTKYNMQYQSAQMFCNSLMGRSNTLSIVNDFLKANKISIKQPTAFGNGWYEEFMDTYYRYLKRSIAVPHRELDISLIKLAGFVNANFPDIREADRIIIKKVADSSASAQEFEKFSHNMSSRYIDDYLGSLPNNSTEFDYFTEAKDPFIRDLFSSRVLFEMMQGKFSFIKSNLPVYRVKISEGKIKDQFLAAYAEQYKKMYASTLSPKSIMINTDDLNSTDVFKTIMEKYKGKIVYVDIWATWCAPCLAEMGNAKRLRDSLGDEKDVVFVYICTSSTDKAQWRNLLAGHQIEGENYYLNDAQSSQLNKELHIKSIPHYVLLNKDGEIVANHTSTPGQPATLSAIKVLLAK